MFVFDLDLRPTDPGLSLRPRTTNDAGPPHTTLGRDVDHAVWMAAVRGLEFYSAGTDPDNTTDEFAGRAFPPDPESQAKADLFLALLRDPAARRKLADQIRHEIELQEPTAIPA